MVLSVKENGYKLWHVSWYSCDFGEETPFQTWVIDQRMGKNRRGEPIYTWEALIHSPRKDVVLRVISIYFSPLNYILFCHPIIDPNLRARFPNFQDRTSVFWDEVERTPEQLPLL